MHSGFKNITLLPCSKGKKNTLGLIDLHPLYRLRFAAAPISDIIYAVRDYGTGQIWVNSDGARRSRLKQPHD